MPNLITAEQAALYGDFLARILLACILGGIIGFERENTNRPAGFRTHILVSVGAALVMLTGEYLASRFNTTDPARIGAQVVSGIGFLGAGTILRSGFHVKGLTTAASLWAVSCVGLACGVGFYFGAIVTACVITVTLVYLKRVERKMWLRNKVHSIILQAKDMDTALMQLNEVVKRHNIDIRHIEFQGKNNKQQMSMEIIYHSPNTTTDEIYKELAAQDAIEDVQIK